jgi:hypothetical protein
LPARRKPIYLDRRCKAAPHRRARLTEKPMAALVTVHDPRGFAPKVTGKRLAPRVQSLDGKTVCLVDCLFDNSAVFMDQLQGWFAANMPAVETRIIRPRESWVDDADMRARVASEGDAAILGVGL